jgi:hypothetical protein
MTIEISTPVILCQDDIVDTLVSFARIGKGIAYSNLYKQYFEEAKTGEIERSFQLIRRAFAIAKQEEIRH